MKVKVIIERGDDGTFDANMEFINSIPFGLLGQGDTTSEAIDDFFNSYSEIKAMYKAEGKECPALEFEFKHDMPTFMQNNIHSFSDDVAAVSFA